RSSESNGDSICLLSGANGRRHDVWSFALSRIASVTRICRQGFTDPTDHMPDKPRSRNLTPVQVGFLKSDISTTHPGMPLWITLWMFEAEVALDTAISS